MRILSCSAMSSWLFSIVAIFSCAEFSASVKSLNLIILLLFRPVSSSAEFDRSDSVIGDLGGDMLEVCGVSFV